MDTKRFTLALERLESGDWARFERFASQFLTQDYPSLRTVANPAGDLGRDSELFSPTGESSVLLQYSVTKNWAAKIRETAVRIRENFKDAPILIYVTNQQIGAKADTLKKDIRSEFKLVVDIHDSSWFIDRVESGARTEIAEKLAIDILDPYLAGRGVIENKATALNSYEAKAAVLHLQLQWEDNSREKGLTKISFDALVKSALRETSSSNRSTIQTVKDTVCRLLPAHPKDVIEREVNSALERLDKTAIRRWHQSNEVCLTHEEVIKVRSSLEQKEIKNNALEAEIRKTLRDYFDTAIDEKSETALCVRVRRVLDAFLFNKGEEFAAAVANGNNLTLRDDALSSAVTNDFVAYPDNTRLGDRAVASTRLAITEILQRSNPEVQRYLREISDGYTLFAFLRAVPDVQKVISKLFINGEIWLDTSVLLPAFAETLLPNEERLISRLLKAAVDAGMKLFVTAGVIEEVERHINRCLVYVRTPARQWTGGVPFLFAMYAFAGKEAGAFPSWVENFCGQERAEDDLAEYLKTELNINLNPLTESAQKTPDRLRWEVERIWRESHEARRGKNSIENDSFVIDRLVDHDVECYLGVIGKRSSAASSELGYAHWWLTFDKTVRELEEKLYLTLGRDAPKAPIMNPDFLSNYLALGPVRSRLSKETEANIPVSLMEILPTFIPAELVQIADEARKASNGANERLMKRKLRDSLDSIKQHSGEYTLGGFHKIREQIEKSLNAAKRQS